MNLLLDSHTALWFSEDDPQLPENLKQMIGDKQNRKFVSVASIWELAIKHALGKLAIEDTPEVYFSDLLRINRFELLPLSFDHVLRGAGLPHHHKDPFDRVIIAQSLIENMPILSRDTIFDGYGVTRLW